MGSEEDIARTLSTVNARIDTPLTQEQERVVQKMLRSQPMLHTPTATRTQRFTANAWNAGWIAVCFLVFALYFLGRLPVPAIYLLLPAVYLVELALQWHFPIPSVKPNRGSLRHIREMLDPHQGFVCLRCHYPLTGLPDDGQCPECGTLYTREQTVRAWKDAYKLKDDWGPL